ncbi:hypothetical protein ES708_31009 [subsurface metagenome]
MGHLKDIKSNLDPQAFPGATFQIEGTVPQAQCSEAKIEGDSATTESVSFSLTDPGKFVDENLNGKFCTITASVGGDPGTYEINFTSDNTLGFTTSPGDGDPVEYYIHNGGELILTRNKESFAAYIHAAGYAYTIKGGKLYTDMPSGLLKDACSILFDPLT